MQFGFMACLQHSITHTAQIAIDTVKITLKKMKTCLCLIRDFWVVVTLQNCQ